MTPEQLDIEARKAQRRAVFWGLGSFWINCLNVLFQFSRLIVRYGTMPNAWIWCGGLCVATAAGVVYVSWRWWPARMPPEPAEPQMQEGRYR